MALSLSRPVWLVRGELDVTQRSFMLLRMQDEPSTQALGLSPVFPTLALIRSVRSARHAKLTSDHAKLLFGAF